LLACVVVFVSYCYSYCDFVRTSTVVIGVFKFKFDYPIYSIYRKKSLIVLGLYHYKYWSKYLLCGRLQASMGADGSWITELPYTVV